MVSYSTDTLPPAVTVFPKLPLELRELIYQYTVILPSSDISSPRLLISAADVTSSWDSRFPNWLPPIAHVNSGTRIDVSLYILRQVEIYIPYRQTLQLLGQFLRTLPIAQGQGAIRRLNFPSFGAARLTKEWETVFIDFAKSCPRLATIQIGINAPDMRKSPEPLPHVASRYGDTMLEAEQVIKMYKLQELTRLDDLVEIFIELCPLYNGKPVNGCVTEIRKVAMLVTNMFADIGKEVTVLVVDFRGKQWEDNA